MHPEGGVSHLTADMQSVSAVGNFYFTICPIFFSVGVTLFGGKNKISNKITRKNNKRKSKTTKKRS
jgi:hypothetical protein